MKVISKALCLPIVMWLKMKINSRMSNIKNTKKEEKKTYRHSSANGKLS